MTDIRTFPASVTIEKVVTLSKANFGYNYITRPLAYYNNPSGVVDSYGYRPTYDNSGTGKTVWDGTAQYQDRVVDDNSSSTDIPTKTANTYIGWIRLFYPSPNQIFQVGTGIHADVMADLLKELDFAHARGMKALYTVFLYNKSSLLSMMSFGNVPQVSAAFESNLKAFFDGLFDSTITSATYGYTFANHPALGAIELGNENTDCTYNNISTDQAGNIHANIVRVAWSVIRTKEVSTYRGSLITILPYAGSGGIQVDNLILYGAEARSQASSNLGTATVASNVFTLPAHGLSNWDMVLCEAVDFPSTYTPLTQKYYVVNATPTTFQLSLTNGGAPVTASSNGGILDIFANFNRYSDSTYNYVQATNLCTYDFTTNTFTQTAHGLPSITSITRSGTTATVTTPLKHNQTVGSTITVSGADQSQYNGTFTITAVNATAKTFTYTMVSDPGATATGTLTLSTQTKVILVGKIGSTTVDSGISIRRRYWVRDVTADTFKLSTTLNGSAMTVTGTPNVKINKNVPVALNGDTGECKHIPHYTDTMSHHFYDNVTLTTDYGAANNKRGWDRTVLTHELAINVPFELYRSHGRWNRATVTADASTNLLQSLINLNLTTASRLQLEGTTLPSPLLYENVYWAVNIDNANKKFGLSLTQGGSAIDITSAGTSVTVNILHPWYGATTRPAVWNTESNISENAGGYVPSPYWSILTKEARKQLLLRWYLSTLMKTSDGNDGVGVSFFYGTEEGSTWTNGTGTPTIGSSGGNLQITIAGDSSPAISTTEQFYLETGANAITDGTNTPLAANSSGYFDILSKTSGTTYVLNTPYTGGAIAGVSYRLARYYHAGEEEWKWMVNLLTSGEVSIGWADRNSDDRYGIFFAVKGVGAWYFDSTGTMRQW